MRPATDVGVAGACRGLAAAARRGAGVALLAAALGGCATAPTAPPPARLDFPSPTSGPGAPELDTATAKTIESGWSSLSRGDAAAARASADRAGAGPASRLLQLQADIVAGGTDTAPALEQLAEEQPLYAAAWLTLSTAAESAGNEVAALSAADRGASLWPAERWQKRATDLRRRWVGDRVASAERLLAEGSPSAAVGVLEPALEIEPDNRAARLVEARAFSALGQPDRAEAALSGLPRDREVVLLAGDIAEVRGDRNAAIRIYSSLEEDPEATLKAIALAEADADWLTAMTLYERLPDSRPEKAQGLRASKLRWRISVMPEHVHEALEAAELDRAGLAVVLVTLAPRVETLPGGQVPLLSDIVDMPSQREIVTAARIGIMDADRLERRFDPERPVTALETRAAVNALARALELTPPRWCGEEGGGDCIRIDSPVSGREVADIVIQMLAEEMQ